MCGGKNSHNMSCNYSASVAIMADSISFLALYFPLFIVLKANKVVWAEISPA